MLRRTLIVAICMLVGAVALVRASKTERVPVRESLGNFPVTLGAWEGRPLPDFDAKILAVLGVDEYLNRMYLAPGKPSVGLYVGYYQSQRQGDTMHSPLNCLPGAGWLPISQKRTEISVSDVQGPRTIQVNDFIIEKGIDRQVVLYWYQSHGRVVASEYWGKIYTVVDAVRLNRSDGALVRLVVPIPPNAPGGVEAAEAAGIAFAQAIFPQLGRYLPS
jgi:EpsI family protein